VCHRYGKQEVGYFVTGNVLSLGHACSIALKILKKGLLCLQQEDPMQNLKAFTKYDRNGYTAIYYVSLENLCVIVDFSDMLHILWRLYHHFFDNRQYAEWLIYNSLACPTDRLIPQELTTLALYDPRTPEHCIVILMVLCLWLVIRG